VKVDLRRPWRAKAILIGGVLLLYSLGGAEPASAQSWSNGYAHRRAITINHAGVPNTDKLNFPFLFSGTYSYLATVPNGGSVTNSSGYDIVFTSDSAGTTTLPFEQESFSAATGAVSYWIQIPTISHTTDTVIYLFYGNSSVTTDQSNGTGVWDSNFKGVWHLPNGTTLSGNDSTSNGNSGTINGAGATNGILSGGASFSSASGQNIDVGDSSSLQITGNAISIEGWLDTSESNPSYWERIIAEEIPNNADPYVAFAIHRCAGSKHAGFSIATGGAGTGVTLCSRSSLVLGSWTHVVGTYDGSTMRIYVNGVLDNSVSETGNLVSTSTDVVFGTDTFLAGETFDGSIDEVRISNTTRSGDWVATEYGNQSSPSTFYAVGFADSSNGYSYRSAITIDHTKVRNTDQTNFPVFVSGTYSYLAITSSGGSVTNSNGYDIIFTSDASGMTPLSYERETYNATTGAINFWVKVPTVSHTTDTVIYMFYGNSSVTTDQSNAAGVWDSNYRGVWHMGSSSTLSGADSTSNGYTLTNNNGTTATSGFINGAASFNGTNNYLSNSSLSIPAGSPITISYWNYVTSADVQSSAVFTIGASDNPNRISEHAPWSDNNLYWDYGSWSGGGRVTQNCSSYLGSWTYVVSEYDASSNTHSLYLNGSLVASNVNSNVPTATQTGIDIGAWPAAGVYQHGNIDEFRVSTTARSAD
jgi:hypothetical protein